jgi:hypothetical protein
MNEVTAIDLRLQHPFTMICAGMTGSGKSVKIRSILKNFSLCTTIQTDILNVFYCYGTWQTPFEEPLPNVRFTYNEGLPDGTNEFKNHHIVIIDDLMAELQAAKNIDVLNLFTKHSHHLNISVIFVTQNLFYKDLLTLRRNCKYLMLFKSPSDNKQVMSLATQLIPSSPKTFVEAYQKATANAHGYILVDNSQYTPDYLRWRTNIVPEDSDDGRLRITIYSPR